MSNNMDNERTLNTSKMYPIDLAPQKITIVKSVSNSEVKMAHLVTGQPITTGAGQIITHTGSLGLLRPSTQIISSNVSSQPRITVSSSSIFQGTQIISQGSQVIGQNAQMLPKAQIIPSGQIIGGATQIISQGTQLNAQVAASGGVCNLGTGNTQVGVGSGGAQLLNVGGLVTGANNLVVSSNVRTLPPSVRVLPPLPHLNTRPVLSSVSLNSNLNTGVVMTKTISSHVPRGPAAGASLAVPRVAARPVTPIAQTMPLNTTSAGCVSGGAWPTSRVRGSGERLAAGVITAGLRNVAPLQLNLGPTPRHVPLVNRNYQPTSKAPPPAPTPPASFNYSATYNTPSVPALNISTVNVVNTRVSPERRASVPSRPTILRKRDSDAAASPPHGSGSTTESASSSPARESPPRLSSEIIRDFPVDEKPESPPPAQIKPPPKRPQLRAGYVCGWRATALHFVRPSDVRRREPRGGPVRRRVRAADGWRLRHLTRQVDGLVSLESDVTEQLSCILRTLETNLGKANSALATHSHTLLELVKGNIQRSRIVCEGIEEARDDILRVFTHRTFVSEILARQADKRSLRKHRSQS